MAYIYIHRRLDNNEIFYIGVGLSIKKGYNRAKDKNNRNKFWEKIVKKYGFTYEILHDNLKPEEALKKEQELISLHGRRNKGKGNLVNLTDGGEGTTNHIKSKKEIENIRKRSIGNKNSLGKKHSQETKDLIREKKLGTKHSKKTKKLLSEIQKGKKKHTKESKEKIANFNYKPVIQYDLNMNFIDEFKGAKIASEILNINEASINKCCQGKRNKAGGFKFKFK